MATKKKVTPTAAPPPFVTGTPLRWRVNTPALLNEILQNNDHMGIFRVPFKVFGSLLYEVGQRAAELNDPTLNRLMLQLAIYEQGDPYMPGYDAELVNSIIYPTEE